MLLLLFGKKLELSIGPNTEMPGVESLPLKNRFKPLAPVLQQPGWPKM